MCLDIDDTLIDCTAALRGTLQALTGRADLWPLWDLITEEHVALVVAGGIDYATMHHRRTECFLAEIGIVADADQVASFELRRRELLSLSWQLFDDVLPCLDWLRAAGVLLAAVTNASGVHQRQKIADLGLAPYFDHVAIAGELGVAKPDPVIFHSVCLGLACEPARTVHVGDKLDTDAIGARDAGLGAVWLDRDGIAERAPAGVHTLSSLEKLPELLVSEFVTVGVPAQRAAETPAFTG
ncbi:HAD family hydrolase [Amycolatopsis sp. H20-H5]|uniref:HAD family hydrolase n=1 Tax=Amycolatopsis sp. H20-H5 TaxID=3046309 RepID=UPI002DBA7B20|nr:HAD family hydrolase [Amycolatopsis sp. H20-H5]MEC3973779.1 HAD family hydrolase [Amycolatopsis sp. H20-H5]